MVSAAIRSAFRVDSHGLEGLPMKVSIVIPVFNEASTVRELLERVYAQSVPVEHKEIIIVESASTDGSREVVQQFVQDVAGQTNTTEVRLILQDAPRGKGHAVQAGLKECSGDIVLIQDADLEYHTADYPALLEPIVTGRTAFVLGSRHMSGDGWKIRKFEDNSVVASFMNFGGVLFHKFFNLVYGQNLTDPTTMYKVFRRSCLEGLSFEAKRFDFDF